MYRPRRPWAPPRRRPRRPGRWPRARPAGPARAIAREPARPLELPAAHPVRDLAAAAREAGCRAAEAGERLKPFPARKAKIALVETMRDLALEDADFARVVLPILEEFMVSRGRSERAACLVAVTRIRHTHAVLRLEQRGRQRVTAEKYLTYRGDIKGAVGVGRHAGVRHRRTRKASPRPSTGSTPTS